MTECRLELIKLVHRHDLDPATLIARAQTLEAYVTGQADKALVERGHILKADKRKPR